MVNFTYLDSGILSSFKIFGDIVMLLRNSFWGLLFKLREMGPWQPLIEGSFTPISEAVCSWVVYPVPCRLHVFPLAWWDQKLRLPCVSCWNFSGLLFSDSFWVFFHTLALISTQVKNWEEPSVDLHSASVCAPLCSPVLCPNSSISGLVICRWARQINILSLQYNCEVWAREQTCVFSI